MPKPAPLSRLMRRWLADRHGGLGIGGGLMIMAAGMLAVGGVEYTQMVAERGRMQDIADQSALNGATQMDLSLSDGVLERTKALALTSLEQMGKGEGVSVVTSYVRDGTAIKVDISGHRDSMLGNLLKSGGWDLNASAVATSESRVPLCVLASGDNLHKTIDLKSTSRIQAPGCFVQSNDDIKVAGGAMLTGFEVRAVTSSTGPVTPEAKTDAAPIPDPFASMDIAFKTQCPLIKLPEIYTDLNAVIGAGMHCGDVVILGLSKVKLQPGEHYFYGDLTVGGSAELVGDDVVLGFNDKSKFDFNGQSRVSLTGRKSGPLAGFVVYSVRSNTHKFTIESDHVDKLLGTIYIPNAELNVTGRHKVADASAWTVIVAKKVKLDGSPVLVLNTDYASSDVPVPTGVGPTRHNSRLVQ